LSKLSERPPEHLHYMGVSYGLTSELYGFWSKNGYVPLYLRLTTLEVTGEHTCIMLKKINPVHGLDFEYNQEWLKQFHQDFVNRFSYLLSYDFHVLPSRIALYILCKRHKDELDREKNYYGDPSKPEINYERLNILFSVMT